MKIEDKCKNSLALGQNANVITDTVYKKLLESCFYILVGKEAAHSTFRTVLKIRKTEIHLQYCFVLGINTLYNSKPDIIKEFFAALLKTSAEFVRNDLPKEEIIQYLTQSCNFTQSRTNIFVEFIEKNRKGVEACLLNIGSSLPHVTDVKWKIDYVVKVVMKIGP